jgi:hypothetical protein
VAPGQLGLVMSSRVATAMAICNDATGGVRCDPSCPSRHVARGLPHGSVLSGHSLYLLGPLRSVVWRCTVEVHYSSMRARFAGHDNTIYLHILQVLSNA